MLLPLKFCKVGVLPSMKLYTSWERFQLLKAGTYSLPRVHQHGLMELTSKSTVLSPCHLETQRRGWLSSMLRKHKCKYKLPVLSPVGNSFLFPQSPHHTLPLPAVHTPRAPGILQVMQISCSFSTFSRLLLLTRVLGAHDNDK